MKKNHKNTIIFDLDSTLVTIEGLDFLAEHKGVGEEVVELLTNIAMEGIIPMNTAMRIKLALIKPSKKDFLHLGQEYIRHLVKGAKEVINTLLLRGHRIYIVTGNFTPSAKVVARHLGIHKNRVFANHILFEKSGDYKGFDHDQPLANNGGKAKVIKGIGKKLTSPIMIGDGITDLETTTVVDKFIGFGGVVHRPAVEKRAKIYVKDPDLKAILPHIY